MAGKLEFSLKEVYQMEASVNKLLSLPLPFDISYKWGKISSWVLEELRFIEQARAHRIQKFIDPGEEKITDPEKEKAFAKEFSNFLEEENVRCPLKFKIDINDKRLSDITIQPRYLIHLSKFISGDFNAS